MSKYVYGYMTVSVLTFILVVQFGSPLALTVFNWAWNISNVIVAGIILRQLPKLEKLEKANSELLASVSATLKKNEEVIDAIREANQHLVREGRETAKQLESKRQLYVNNTFYNFLLSRAVEDINGIIVWINANKDFNGVATKFEQLLGNLQSNIKKINWNLKPNIPSWNRDGVVHEFKDTEDNPGNP